MSDTLGRLIRRVPAATVSTSNPGEAGRALSALTGHVAVTSDINHLANISAVRPVVAHPGFPAFYRGPMGSGGGAIGTWSDPPTPSQVMWTAPGLDAGAANFYARARVDTYGVSQLPKVTLRCWVQAPPSGTESVGVVLAVNSGLQPTTDDPHDGVIVTNTSGEDVDIEVAITREMLREFTNTSPRLGYAPSGVAPFGEPFSERFVFAWVGFFNTSDKNSDTAAALGITVALEAP